MAQSQVERERFWDGAARPDPALGVFETLLARGGEAVALDAHLRRLARSVGELYGYELPPGLRERVARAAALRIVASGDGEAALRIVALPDGAVAVERGALLRRALPIALAPVVVAGGLGAHKWRDRRLLDALTARAGGATPLLLDRDGSVLEAAWASVLVERAGELLTPCEDGRILPGTARPPARQTRLTLADLRGADAILVSSSLAGVVPATLRER